MSLINKLVLAFLLVTIVPLSAIIGVLHYTFLRHAEVTGIPLVHGHLVGALVVIRSLNIADDMASGKAVLHRGNSIKCEKNKRRTDRIICAES
jgi:hypothetical protein